MKIALCQISVFWEETEQNLNNHQRTIDSLFGIDSGIDIIVFPEFYSTGFSIANKAKNHETEHDHHGKNWIFNTDAREPHDRPFILWR